MSVFLVQVAEERIGRVRTEQAWHISKQQIATYFPWAQAASSFAGMRIHLSPRAAQSPHLPQTPPSPHLQPTNPPVSSQPNLVQPQPSPQKHSPHPKAANASATSLFAIPCQYRYFFLASSSVSPRKIVRPGITLRLRGSRPNWATLLRCSATLAAAALGVGWAMKTASACCNAQ